MLPLNSTNNARYFLIYGQPIFSSKGTQIKSNKLWYIILILYNVNVNWLKLIIFIILLNSETKLLSPLFFFFNFSFYQIKTWFLNEKFGRKSLFYNWFNLMKWLTKNLCWRNLSFMLKPITFSHLAYLMTSNTFTWPTFSTIILVLTTWTSSAPLSFSTNWLVARRSAGGSNCCDGPH